MKRSGLGICMWLALILSCQAQKSSFFLPSDTLNAVRLKYGVGVSTVAYGLTMYGLGEVWYKESLTNRFHFKDDWGAWRNMDKYGHVMTTYFESLWVADCLQWAGLDRRTAAWYGVGAGTLFQTSIEVLDGFSDRWGFSWTDAAANTLGAALFIGQEYAWQEQRLQLKWSAQRVSYPQDLILSADETSTTTIAARANQLYGYSFAERLLKDYNGQTVWLSVNISDFLHPSSSWPEWLNISFGVGAQNMLGGFENQWSVDGSVYQLPNESYPRYSQFYIGPDINLRKIKTQSPFLNTILRMLNVIRLPLPALEITSRGEWVWRWTIL